nr:unnamed protein product [Callosobruchus analis]
MRRLKRRCNIIN